MSDLAFENLRKVYGGELPDYIDPPLTEKEKAAVLEQEDHGVKNPLPQKTFKGIEDFIEGENNFHALFIDIPAGYSPPLYRTRRVYQRFEILYPELNERLVAYKLDALRSNWPIEAKRDLFDAYTKMSALVDRNDRSVQIEVEGGWDEDQLANYLCN